MHRTYTFLVSMFRPSPRHETDRHRVQLCVAVAGGVIFVLTALFYVYTIFFSYSYGTLHPHGYIGIGMGFALGAGMIFGAVFESAIARWIVVVLALLALGGLTFLQFHAPAAF